MVHFASLEGAGEIAAASLGKLDLRDFVSDVRGGLLPKEALDVTFEEVKEEQKPAEEEVPPPPEPDKPKPEKAKADKKADPKAPEPKKDEPKKPPPPPPPPKLQLPPMVAVPPPPPPPPPEPEKRVAVQQNVEDKNQQDNPDAKHIGDDANHVKEETQAKLTNHDRNDKTTSPGARQKDSADKDTGNADKTAIRDAEDKKGDSKKAPGESSQKDQSAEVKAMGKAAGNARPAAGDQSMPQADKLGQNGREGPKIAPQLEPPRAAAEKPAPKVDVAPPAPEVQKSPDGTYTVSPFAKDQPKPTGSALADAKPPPSSAEQKKAYSIPKWGGGAGPNGVNFNMTPGGAHAALGEATLKHERENEGERIRSAHRGKWKPSGLDRIHMQIENYVAVVKEGNQTALNTARVPFATYLNHIHNKLHPIFAEDFLASLENRGEKDPINQPLKTVMEVTLDPETGKLVEGKWGIVKQSGVTQFDVGALDAMDRAAPFGKAPSAIISPDGFVHLHWEFHRRPEIACTTQNARPLMMKGAPPATPGQPTLPGPRNPEDPRENTPSAAPPSREGTAPTKVDSARAKSG
jgi:hypothetical protein